MTFSSSNFAYYVYIYLDNNDLGLKLSNNFFDLSPGWEVTVKILSDHKLQDI